MKKYLWIIICIILTTIVLIVTNNILYGTERIYIADYMPTSRISPISGKMVERTPWHTVKLDRTISDMKIAFIIGIVLSTIESIILYKKQILKKDIINLILILLIYVIPILIASIKLSSIYGYTL